MHSHRSGGVTDECEGEAGGHSSVRSCIQGKARRCRRAIREADTANKATPETSQGVFSPQSARNSHRCRSHDLLKDGSVRRSVHPMLPGQKGLVMEAGIWPSPRRKTRSSLNFGSKPICCYLWVAELQKCFKSCLFKAPCDQGVRGSWYVLGKRAKDLPPVLFVARVSLPSRLHSVCLGFFAGRQTWRRNHDTRKRKLYVSMI